MKKVLVMDFMDSAAKRFSFRVPDPKDDLSPDDVYEALQALIAKMLLSAPLVRPLKGHLS